MSITEQDIFTFVPPLNERRVHEPTTDIGERIHMLYQQALSSPGLAIPITFGNHVDQPHLLPESTSGTEARANLETEAINGLARCFSEAAPGSKTPLQFGLNGLHIEQAIFHIDFGHVDGEVLYTSRLAEPAVGSTVEIWAGHSPRGKGIALAFVNAPRQ